MHDGETADRRKPQRREAALQARWAAGEWRGQTLRARDGAAYTVLYQGRPGGGVGPDFRDAVLAHAGRAIERAARKDDDRLKTRATPPEGADSLAGARVYGDIELHLRASDWRAHGHASDPRYNNLALHVVFDEEMATRAQRPERPAQADTLLASGRRIPVAHLVANDASASERLIAPASWPCASFATHLNRVAQHDLFLRAGMARFVEKADRFRTALHQHAGDNIPSGALSTLWPDRRQSAPSDGALWSHADRV